MYMQNEWRSFLIFQTKVMSNSKELVDKWKKHKKGGQLRVPWTHQWITIYPSIHKQFHLRVICRLRTLTVAPTSYFCFYKSQINNIIIHPFLLCCSNRKNLKHTASKIIKLPTHLTSHTSTTEPSVLSNDTGGPLSARSCVPYVIAVLNKTPSITLCINLGIYMLVCTWLCKYILKYGSCSGINIQHLFKHRPSVCCHIVWIYLNVFNVRQEHVQAIKTNFPSLTNKDNLSILYVLL